MIDAGDIPTGRMLATNTGDPSIAAAYDAPFPEPVYKAGALIMPQRVPVFADDPANEANREAWEVFERWEKPFLTAYGDRDPITRGGEVPFQRRVPGAQGQPHVKVEGAGHFIPGDARRRAGGHHQRVHRRESGGVGAAEDRRPSALCSPASVDRESDAQKGAWDVEVDRSGLGVCGVVVRERPRDGGRREVRRFAGAGSH